MRTPEVSKLLRQVRLNAGMTQQELADVLMVDKAYISRVENGHQIPDAITYNNWLAVTKGPIFAFTYVFGEDGGATKLLQTSI